MHLHTTHHTSVSPGEATPAIQNKQITLSFAVIGYCINMRYLFGASVSRLEINTYIKCSSV